jgi:16S rRNA (guanine527-N7)-methyltransferase
MDRLRAGAEKLGITLSEADIGKFRTFYEELIEWNQRINLTSITGYERVQVDHFLDALTVLTVWRPQSPQPRVMDVGAGAGIPGIPLKIAYPQIRLTLLEATAKKTGFLRHIVGKLELGDTQVVVGRAEDMAQEAVYREQFDLVLARGVARLATLAELTLPLCRTGGLVIAHKRGQIEAEVNEAAYAIGVLGGKLKEMAPVTMPEFTDNRALVVIEKVLPTPEKYPRRAGMPAKRPLTGEKFQ